MNTVYDFQAHQEAMAGAERSLLATVISHGDELKHAELLLPQDFAFPSHQVLWAEILAFGRDGQLSIQAVINSLVAKSQLSDLGHEFGSVMGMDYLNELVTYSAAQSTEYFAQTVMNSAVQRAVRRSAALWAADSDRMDLPPDELLDRIESDILTMRRNRGNDGQSIGSLLDLFQKVTEQRRSGTFVPALTPHIIPIKSIVKFYEAQDYPIIAARPGEGKSSIMRYEAFYEAIEGRPTTILNLENGELEYARHLVSLQTQIDNELLRNPSALTDDQMQRVKDAIENLRAIPLRIITMGAPTIEEVSRVYLDAVRWGTKSFWLDYVQLINNRVNDLNTNTTISSTRLRGLSQKHHIPLIIASQMSRNIVNRGTDAEPELSDLRDSGSLEQDATHVLFPRMAWGANPRPQDIAQFPENQDGAIRVVPLRVYIKKNRNGSVGKTNPFKWDRSTNNFEAL
jgi:replicative DNA helicase